MEKLSFESWNKKIKEHENLVSPHADAFLKRRELGKTHAVYDFLFTYYTCSPQKLKEWIPSIEQELEGGKKGGWFTDYWFQEEGGSLRLDRNRLSEAMKELAAFVYELCKNISAQPPRFKCFGLHEWAMVYKSSAFRHQGYRLRLSQEELAAFVESQNLCCSHYDAYRFFTEEAKPMNALAPTLETRLTMEQGGCLHANMDIYKWSVKLWPWVGSDFMARAYGLALSAREMDMRASPYDLSEAGFLPIKIETEEGRREYQRMQQELAETAKPLRDELQRLSGKIVEIGNSL